MSDASEVKRWWIEDNEANREFPAEVAKPRYVEVIAIEDHDRIMAERDELWKRATKFVMPGEMDTGESIEHYIKTLEQANDKLKAELANRDSNERSWLVAKEIEIGAVFVGQLSEMQETIARQARVIEKLKLQRGTILHEKYAGFPLLAMNTESDLDKELEAIEQGAFNVQDDLKNEIAEKDATIARQAKVIKNLKRYTQHRVDCINRTGVFQYSNDCDCGLEAIEKGEGT